MSNPEDDKARATRRSSSGAGIFLVIGGIALFFYFVEVEVPKLLSQLNDQIPVVLRDVLLWLSTNKTLEILNAIGSEWSGLLGILSIGLAVILYVLSQQDKSTKN